MSTRDAKRRVTDWFRQWRDPLLKFLVGRTGVRAADVEDVGQEVFLRLMRYEKLDLIEHPQAYLYKIASNVAAEWSMRARSRAPHAAQWLEELVDGEQPDESLLRMQSGAEIRRALATLSDRQREVLKLYFGEELGYAEIAQRTGATLRSVRRDFERSYEKLRHELDPELLKTYQAEALRRGRD